MIKNLEFKEKFFLAASFISNLQVLIISSVLDYYAKKLLLKKI